MALRNEGLVARGHLYFCDALLALYEAAPVELAFAPLDPLLPPRRVAAVAAHQAAAVNVLAVL